MRQHDDKDNEDLQQIVDDLQDDARKRQLAIARPAKWPESSYEQGLRIAKDIIANGDKLKQLTAKQGTFVQALLDGASATEAYRFAYDQPHESPSQIHARASFLQKQPHVAYEIFIQKQKQEERLLKDRTQAQRFVIEHLQRIVETPGTHHAARVNALNLLGKYSGLFGDNPQQSRTHGNVEQELLGRLRVLMNDPRITIEGQGSQEEDEEVGG
jgi:hypothetical protein